MYVYICLAVSLRCLFQGFPCCLIEKKLSGATHARKPEKRIKNTKEPFVGAENENTSGKNKSDLEICRGRDVGEMHIIGVVRVCSVNLRYSARHHVSETKVIHPIVWLRRSLVTTGYRTSRGRSSRQLSRQLTIARDTLAQPLSQHRSISDSFSLPQ